MVNSVKAIIWRFCDEM